MMELKIELEAYHAALQLSYIMTIKEKCIYNL